MAEFTAVRVTLSSESIVELDVPLTDLTNLHEAWQLCAHPFIGAMCFKTTHGRFHDQLLCSSLLLMPLHAAQPCKHELDLSSNNGIWLVHGVVPTLIHLLGRHNHCLAAEHVKAQLLCL